jgi:hypothetical protein
MRAVLVEQIAHRYSHQGAAIIQIPWKPMRHMPSTAITRRTLHPPAATLGVPQCLPMLIQVRRFLLLDSFKDFQFGVLKYRARISSLQAQEPVYWHHQCLHQQGEDY